MRVNKFLLHIIILLYILQTSISLAEDMSSNNFNITDKILREQLDRLNIKELELVLEDILEGNQSIYSKTSIKDNIISMIKGEQRLNFKHIKDGVIESIFKEILNNLNLIIQLFAITVICSVLTNLQSSFSGSSVSQLAHYVCYIILAMLMINSFMLAQDLAKKAWYKW